MSADWQSGAWHRIVLSCTTAFQLAAGLVGVSFCGATVVAEPTQSAAVLEFLDGASLHGRLRSMNTERGVGWEYPEAKQLIEFRPSNIASIIFEGARPITARSHPTCRFRFHNGDELYGNLLGVDGERVELD